MAGAIHRHGHHGPQQARLGKAKHQKRRRSLRRFRNVRCQPVSLVSLISRVAMCPTVSRPPYSANLNHMLLGIRYNVELVALLRSAPDIRAACGFGDDTPNKSVSLSVHQAADPTPGLGERTPHIAWSTDCQTVRVLLGTRSFTFWVEVAQVRIRFSAGLVPGGIRTRSVQWRVLRVILSGKRLRVCKLLAKVYCYLILAVVI